MSKQNPKAIAFNMNGDVSEDVAPDLGEVYGTRQRGLNKLKSSNPVVQTAIDSRETKTVHIELPCPVQGNERRLLQMELGIEPPKQLLDFYKNLSLTEKCLYLNTWKVIKQTTAHKEILKALGVKDYEEIFTLEQLRYSQAKDQYESLIKEVEGETKQFKSRIQELKDDADGRLKNFIDSSTEKHDEIEAKIRGALSSATKEFTEKTSSLETDVSRLKETVRKETEHAKSEVSQNIQDVKSSAEGQIKGFIKSHESEYGDLVGKLKGLLTSATIGSLSKQFEKKRNRLCFFYAATAMLFYALLIGFAGIGWESIKMASSLVTPELIEKYGSFAFVFKMPVTLLRLAPFYLPLLWATIHMNKLMNQNHRLTEEYSHKVVVAETYMGIAKQIEELEQKGVKQADTLSQDLLISTIRVLCDNPNLSLDKVKTQTPISEVVDSAAKLLNASAELKKRAEATKD